MSFNFDFVFCNFFLFSFFSLEVSLFEKTVNKSSGASLNSEDSQ